MSPFFIFKPKEGPVLKRPDPFLSLICTLDACRLKM